MPLPGTQPMPDRINSRPPLPSCPRCFHTETVTEESTPEYPHIFYYRCSECRQHWAMTFKGVMLLSGVDDDVISAS